MAGNGAGAAVPRRDLGTTEKNWCLAVDGGTGVTVTAFLFGRSLAKAHVQAAINELLSKRPFLNSLITSTKDKLSFELNKEVVTVREEQADAYGKKGSSITELGPDEEEASEVWLQIVDTHMNIPFPKTKPLPILAVYLVQNVPDHGSLVILRTHSGATDMACVGTIGEEFLNSLKGIVQREDGEATESQVTEGLQKVTLGNDVVEKFQYDKSIEESIPKGGSNKPFWAHGTDVIGYGLAAKRQDSLPFQNTEAQRKSHLLRAGLSKEATDHLFKACKDNSTDLYGALSAAGLKSAASLKKKGTNFCITVLYNCRNILDPQLPADSLGFYQSAILKNTNVVEADTFWKLAAKATNDIEESIKKRKHFTDMGSLNMLMVQAVQKPSLTPFSTQRTSTFSIPHEPAIETTQVEAAEFLQLKDYVSASSIGGVGPCLAFFPFLRDGALSFSFVYCSPLFSRQYMQNLVDSIIGYLTV